MTEDLKQPATRDISRVVVEIPPFWRMNEKIRFIQVDSHFMTANFTAETTIYDRILGTLGWWVTHLTTDFITQRNHLQRLETSSRFRNWRIPGEKNNYNCWRARIRRRETVILITLNTFSSWFAGLRRFFENDFYTEAFSARELYASYRLGRLRLSACMPDEIM